jgi:tetratricopeptide (TPR) repeat protein
MLKVDHHPEIHVGRFENLQDDFLEIMEKVGVRQIPTLKSEFDKTERKNTSRHSHYSHYFDDELRDLVGSKESELIARYGYQFERLGSAGEITGSGSRSGEVGSREFRKLLGRANNYLLIQGGFDVEAIKNKVAQISEAKWLESERERRFDVHRDTQALLLIHFEDYKYEKPEYRELYYEFEDELKPLIDHIAAYYQDNGFVVRLIFAKLLAGGVIPKHADGGYSLLNCHRVHIPIITNDKNIFFVNGEEKNMQSGELWEINNELVHTVENRGEEDRVHLIIDWMPNHDGKTEEAVLTQDQPDGAGGQRGDIATLNAMVGEAYQIHRSGQVRRAESIYLQVLDIDENHVNCNNLLGLLCLQMKRPEEAVKYIRKALDVDHEDAQAQSNLGLALKDLNRFEEAAAHFQQALLLVPNNPKTYNNLGNIFRQLDRLDEAIASYEKAIIIQPAYAEALHNLGSALVLAGRFSDAAKVLQRSLAVRPGFAHSQRELDAAMAGLKSMENAESKQ